MEESIQFLGGAGTVTGSKFLLNAQGKRILVDCGLFQGLKELRLQNWTPLPVAPARLDAVILTHAHLDHTGYLPLLVRDGFSGPVFCTEPTRELTRVILMDSAKIQEEDAARANAFGYTRHQPAKPLYTSDDAVRALKLLRPIPLKAWTSLQDPLCFRFRNSGHILGSAWVEIDTGRSKLAFSGDLGRSDPLLLPPPDPIEEADYIVVESTYGDRLHSPISPLRELAWIINGTLEKHGQILIPAFAVGRTQDVLYLISKLKEQAQIPDVPVFVDSPMGSNATEIFLDYPDWHNLSNEDVRRIADSATMVKNTRQSEELLNRKESAIVIAGSGMLSGGRILAHLAARLGDERNTVILVGFQPAGTRGALLRSGATDLKIHGKYVSVRARIEEISTLSAHGDQRDVLKWLGSCRTPPKKTFIVHGEPQAADALRLRLKDELNWSSITPKLNDIWNLEAASPNSTVRRMSAL